MATILNTTPQRTGRPVGGFAVENRDIKELRIAYIIDMLELRYLAGLILAYIVLLPLLRNDLQSVTLSLRFGSLVPDKT